MKRPADRGLDGRQIPTDRLMRMQRTRAACALADRSEFDVRQGRDQPVASFSVDGRDPEAAVILEQLLLGIMLVAVTLLLLPFLLVMAGVGAELLLWFVVSAAVLGALI